MDSKEYKREWSPTLRAIIDDRNQRIREDRLNGLSVQEISGKYDLSLVSVYNITRGNPYPPSRIRKLGMPEDKERNLEIRRRYDDGTNTPQLASEYGVSRERICQILRKTNSIELRNGRRRLAKEALRDEVAQVRVALKQEYAQKLEEGLALVRNGVSIRQAAIAIGLNSESKMNALGVACKERNIETSWGRWRNQSQKINRIRELRSLGHSWEQIKKICKEEGLRAFNPGWLMRHAPDLLQKTPVQPAVKIEREEIMWTEEKSSKLLELWLNGSSAQQCADILGVTRNTVIGKVHRMRDAGLFKRKEEERKDGDSSNM